MKKFYTLLLAVITAISGAYAQSAYVKEHYTKKDVYITMRDGVKLFTSIYTPNDASAKTSTLL